MNKLATKWQEQSIGEFLQMTTKVEKAEDTREAANHQRLNEWQLEQQRLKENPYTHSAFNTSPYVDRMTELGVAKSTVEASLRSFDTGATRDTETGKLDYEGFLSPLVLRRYAEFMNKNRIQKDGTLRDSDNWQRGIPLTVYMKSAFRHFIGFWAGHRTGQVNQEELCALLFNISGYLHELLKAESNAK